MRVGFFTWQLSLRGTEVALADYARCNESLLGNSSIVIAPRYARCHDARAQDYFESQFDVRYFQFRFSLGRLLKDAQIDLLYAIKPGRWDGLKVPASCRYGVHVVFPFWQPHGDVYAFVSPWLRDAVGQAAPVVPHMVSLPRVGENLRGELDIPTDALVVGRHGGADTFDLPFVHQAVAQVLNDRPDVYFLFLNTLPFAQPHPRIIHLPATSDIARKTQFVQTCDLMLHARERGETFGLAVAEFLYCGKPVMTFANSPERAHLDLIGENGWLYQTGDELVRLLVGLSRESLPQAALSGDYSPERVMEQFSKVFIEGSILPREKASKTYNAGTRGSRGADT